MSVLCVAAHQGERVERAKERVRHERSGVCLCFIFVVWLTRRVSQELKKARAELQTAKSDVATLKSKVAQTEDEMRELLQQMEKKKQLLVQMAKSLAS